MKRSARAGLLVLLITAAGCGGSGGNLPTSLPSSLPTSLPTRTTTTQPTLTSTPTTSAPPTVSTPLTGVTSTETTTAVVTATGSTSGSGDSTPWGWIAAVVVLVVAAVLIAGWALGRRGAARKSWRAQALQATVDGTALHDGAVAELIAATSANRAERWSAIGTDAGELSASLQRLEAASPDADATGALQAAVGAVTELRSAVAIAGSAPSGVPLDEEAARTLRQRLDRLSAAMLDVRNRAAG